MDNLRKGLLFTSILALLVILFFFGNILRNPNQTFFAPGGDGFKSYYSAIYHLECDSSYFKFEGMNYPYGESVFFTDNQPLLTNTVKWISNNLVDIRENVVGIINLSIIFSVLIAAIFLFLVFSELNVLWWFASLASAGICMLSPQIGRMAGHFSLSHLFWIPAMLYLIIRFSKKPGWGFSTLIALVGFLAASMQLYFIGFYGLLLTFYWLFAKNWLKESWSARRNAFLHWFLQIGVPFILLEILMISTDQMTDRTTHPYGFLTYLAHPVSVLLPSGAPYSFVPKYIRVFNHLDWEAYAFIGIAALSGFLIGVVLFLKKLVTRKDFWNVSSNSVLTAFFWASFVALLLSFGIPFVMGMDWLIDYIGPFRQLRALSRFSWLFFYVVNVLVFYQLYVWFSNRRNSVCIAVLLVAFGFLFVDGIYNLKATAPRLDNAKPLLADRNNQLPENKWVGRFDVSRFQAILPLPYFHVGSENIWIEPGFNSLENTLIASIKTHLPTTAVMMGRTSISQTYRNYALVMEPLHDYDILADFKSHKDILLMVMKGYQHNRDEQRIQAASAFLTGNDLFDLFRLPFDSLKQIPRHYHKQILEDFKHEKLVQKEHLLVSDTTSFLDYQNYDDEVNTAYTGTGAHALKVKEWNTLFEKPILNAKKGETYLASFWQKDFRHDAYPRFNVEVVQTNSNGQTIDYFYSDIHRYIRAIDKEWALYEIPINIKEDNVLLKFSMRNNVLRKADYVIDEFLIRRSDNNIYQQADNLLIRNTRKFQLN
jgi:hypothetical protein